MIDYISSLFIEIAELGLNALRAIIKNQSHSLLKVFILSFTLCELCNIIIMSMTFENKKQSSC